MTNTDDSPNPAFFICHQVEASYFKSLNSHAKGKNF